MSFFSPKMPTPPAMPDPRELEAASQQKAQEEMDKLRKGKVKTILTSGEGISMLDNQRRTVLGG